MAARRGEAVDVHVSGAEPVRAVLLDRAPGSAWWAMPKGSTQAVAVRWFSTRQQWREVTL